MGSIVVLFSEYISGKQEMIVLQTFLTGHSRGPNFNRIIAKTMMDLFITDHEVFTLP